MRGSWQIAILRGLDNHHELFCNSASIRKPTTTPKHTPSRHHQVDIPLDRVFVCVDGVKR
jgi:hypothetical protein